MSDAVRTRDITPFGSSAQRTTFWDSAYHKDEIKHAERLRVLDFLLTGMERFPKDNRHGRLLSFPGLSWVFETMIQKAMPCQFVGLERSPLLYHRSRAAMPTYRSPMYGTNSPVTEKTRSFGNSEFLYSSARCDQKMHDVGGRENRLLLMDAETYATAFFTNYGAKQHERDDFEILFYRRNCVWLDFTSQLSKPVESVIRHLLFCLHPGDFQKPVVITVLNGRDYCRSEQERIDRMIEVQPAFVYRKHWTYVGKGGTSMLTACFSCR